MIDPKNIPEPVIRLRKYQGLNKDKDRCPSNPCITVREAIEIANYIKSLEEGNKRLAAGLAND